MNGNKVVTFLQDICHREDPTRPVTMGIDRIENALDNNFVSAVDIPDFNYKPAWYEKANTRLPPGFILGTETASTLSSRGVYKFPVVFYKNKVYDDNQSSSYDFEFCTWSQIPDDEFVKQDDLQYVLGELYGQGLIIWVSPLYMTKSGHHTVLILESLISPVCQKTGITSYPSAELFVNGRSMGKQVKNNGSSTSRYCLMWTDVKYKPGTIKVVAYDQSGKPVAQVWNHFSCHI
ncbi:DUF4982 domain-containing protein [Pedobacter hartonius]|uniref:Beta-galactosidase n=1 Tax=Pedobacter hartonius TaxID=425514 RepID=A0A1H4DLF6_9SPHI|nr:DUF4982 domain-containing protein [Pedobacter hartonius]SEA73544.1 beta-galactosidase [Pedobacter hartonius]